MIGLKVQSISDFLSEQFSFFIFGHFRAADQPKSYQQIVRQPLWPQSLSPEEVEIEIITSIRIYQTILKSRMKTWSFPM